MIKIFKKALPVCVAVGFFAISGFVQAAIIEVVNDGGFEGGTPNGAWVETSTNFGTPLCDIPSCGTGAGTGPRTGDWWAWFGGTASDEAGTVSQDVTIAAGSSATLSFYYEVSVDNAQTALLEVILGGTTIFSDDATSGIFTYTLQSFDISSFADGGTYALEFNSSTVNGTTNMFIDDVSILVDTGVASVSAPIGVSLFGLGLLTVVARRKLLI